MELKSCGNKHFIQAIRGGSVVKVPNADSDGRPALLSKTLKEVYEGLDAKALQKPSPINSRSMHAGPVLDHKHVKCEVPCLPVVDRTLKEIKPETDEFVGHSHSGSDSDSDDQITLKQLKDRFLKKKRKFSCTDDNSNLAYENENESDLNEPIINLKLKNSRKSKAKSKCTKQRDVSCSTAASDIKSEPDLVSEGSQLFDDLAPAIQVKVEFSDAEELGGQRKPSLADGSPISHNDVESPAEKVSKHREPLLCAEECLNCVTNEISYDHLDDSEPTSVLLPSDGMSVKLEPLESCCYECLDLPNTVQKGKDIGNGHCCSLPSCDKNTDAYMLSRSLSDMEGASTSSSAVRFPDMAVDCTTGPIELPHEVDFVQFGDTSKSDSPHEQDSYLNTLAKSHSFSQESATSSKIDDNLVSTQDTVSGKEEALTCTLNDIAKNGLNFGSKNTEDELLKNKEEQASASPFADAGGQSSPKDRNFDSADAVSTSQPRQPPERLLSTRKAISPSSEEQLCLVMNSVELTNDVDKYIGSECKGLHFEKQIGKKASSIRSDIQHGKITVNHGGHAPASQRKLFISSRHIIRKSPIVKVNVEGPQFSRSPPNPSTGSTSIHICSENAIAFSQRQMQDMESLAMKLMNELKSLKDIVEQKLLFEAYRNVSLKNDADEVKSVINSATKMEESAQKWLSMMARDCDRFCKIMKLTPNDVDASKTTVPRERRKIMFADEAGGKLCHVKFFEDGVTSADSGAVRQCDH